MIASAEFDGTGKEKTVALSSGVIGKHAVYFEFVSDEPEESYIFDRFSFDR